MIFNEEWEVMGDMIRKITSSDIPLIKGKLEAKKSKEKEIEDISPKDLCSIGDVKTRRSGPSADFHTRRAEVLEELVSGAAEKIKKSEPPKFITVIDDKGLVSKEGQKEKFNIGDIFDYLTGDKEVNETPSNTDINQTQYLKELTDTLGSLARIQNQQDISKLNGRIPTVSELDDEFKKLADDKKIPYEYIIDGCYARAHLMCETMMKDDINCSKMFVMTENLFGGGMLKAENKFMKAEWWYHVAPLVFAKDEKTDKIEGYIMDPGMSNKPMKAEEWIGAMWDKSFKIKVDVTRVPQYGPLEGGEMNETFEEYLSDARQTAKDYSKVLAEIKEEYYEHHPDEKPPDKLPLTIT